ncbi:lipopolysaccharide biosynthesis protein [Antarcticibacterium arcticum]|uniref:Lipopolysaccharide biosynthesis protein n=1 Tax=Antarcticibacterium arcticum TaxID=2585771 RepID=A0A5B8YF25_9FLAO|nr:lipopolysaccharide biosynthesis protein [Antarcticibacterium arcticum]QED36505.1 lipopolysaccharide biosynthesis protein [Antarcticibacterium arcticum]
MSLKKKAALSLVWTFTQQFGNQLIGFFVSLVLARILLPAEFGLIGMIVVVVAVGNVLLDGGLTKSLIRDPDCDEEDYSTVFFFHLIASLLIYAVIFLIAPLIANFYEQPLLTSITRVYSLSIIITSFSVVQMARLTKVMDFKTQAIIAIPASLIGGVAGVWMAYTGYGVWSLVWSGLITSIVSTVLLWFHSNWLPSFSFNMKKFRKHFDFGYKLTLSDLLNRIFNNIFLIVIGKYFSAGQVGFYTRAETMKQLPIVNITNALNKVTFPLFVSIQDDDIRLRRVYKKLMLMVMFVIAPVLIFLAVLAEPVFVFLFTAKWLPAVPYFQILCVTGILYPLHSYNLTILNVKGRSDLFLKLEVIKKIIIILTILIAIPFGILALLYGQVLISLIGFFINAHYTKRFIGYTGWAQLKDVFPIIFLAAFAGFGIFIADHLGLHNQINFIRILAGGIIGISIYLPVAYFLKFSSLSEFRDLILKK